MSNAVAIVGAGVAGAGAAYALADTPLEVTVFERDDTVGGRAGTARRDDCVYDHGANYVTGSDDRVARLLTEELAADGLVDVPDPVWPFDGAGTIAESDREDHHKWTYEGGIDRLVELLFEATDATVETGTRVEEPIRRDGGWRLRDDCGADLGGYDAVLLTPPAPRTADLLGNANWEHRHCRTLREAVAVVPYRTIVSAVLHYPVELDRPYYALVNDDKTHDVWWVSREECKDGHVPEGECVLVVQASPDWSVEHFDDPDEQVADAAADVVADLLDEEALASPDWADVRRYRYAQPEGTPDEEPLAAAEAHDLFVAGDWVAGEGRIHAALSTGLAAGDRIAAQCRDDTPN